MKRYISLIRTSFLVQIIYRGHVFLTVLGNIVYLILIFHLWKAIFNASNGTLHGATFNQVFINLGCASAIFVLFRNYIEWFISHDIISGNIIIRLINPIDYQLSQISRAFGSMLFSLFVVALPTFIILYILFGSQSTITIASFIFFIPSLFFAFLISALIDYCTGCCAFYTESIWGISTAKEAIVLFLSGAMIPISFFPKFFQSIITCLPFQAIYSLPLTILFSHQNISSILRSLIIQCIWIILMVLISRLLFMHASRAITINGG